MKGLNKVYFNEPDYFIFYSCFVCKDDDYVEFLETIQSELEAKGHRPKILVNAPDALSPNDLNHCFRVAEELDLTDWQTYGTGIPTKLFIKKTCDPKQLLGLIETKTTFNHLYEQVTE